jgi:hypothetical protein
MEVYRTSAQAPAPGTEAVAVFHCSDPRYQPHFAEFLRSGLELDRYALVAVPGGPQCLAQTNGLPALTQAGWRWTDFLAALMRPTRVVLIQHDDCRWYIETGPTADPALVRQRQVDDLHSVGAAIAARMHGVRVDLFYATLETTGARIARL